MFTWSFGALTPASFGIEGDLFLSDPWGTSRRESWVRQPFFTTARGHGLLSKLLIYSLVAL